MKAKKPLLRVAVLVFATAALMTFGCSESALDETTALASLDVDMRTDQVDLSTIPPQVGALVDQICAGVNERKESYFPLLKSTVFTPEALESVRAYASLLARGCQQGSWLCGHECLVVFQHQLCRTTLSAGAREGIMRELLNQFVDETGLSACVGKGFRSIDDYMQALQEHAPNVTLERMSTLFNSCRCDQMGLPATWSMIKHEYEEDPMSFEI